MNLGEAGVSRERLTSTAGSSEATRGKDACNGVQFADGATADLKEDHLWLFPTDNEQKPKTSFCGLITVTSVSRFIQIPYEHILWAEIIGTQFVLHYANAVAKTQLRPATFIFPTALDTHSCDIKQLQTFIHELHNRAYGLAQNRKRIKVIINPFGGKGKAAKYWTRDIEPIFRAAKCEVDVVNTTHSGHAVEIAEELDIEQWDVAACCSGDGVPYEVFNGLGLKKNATKALGKIAVVQLPCGSGNAMSLNLNGTDSPSMAALAVVKGQRTPLDLVSITQGDRRTLSFLSQSIGIVAESDLATENIRWMGSARFTVGFLLRLLGKTVWPCDIAFGVEMDDKKAIEKAYKGNKTPRHDKLDSTSSSDIEASSPSIQPPADMGYDGLPPLRYGTVSSPLPPGWNLAPYPHLGNFYAGNMPFMTSEANFFPFARPSDGTLDLITIPGDGSTIKALKLLGALGEGKLWQQDIVMYRKVSGYRIVPRQKEGYISVDGERYPFEGFQVEVHRGLGCSLSRKGVYEFEHK